MATAIMRCCSCKAVKKHCSGITHVEPGTITAAHTPYQASKQEQRHVQAGRTMAQGRPSPMPSIQPALCTLPQSGGILPRKQS